MDCLEVRTAVSNDEQNGAGITLERAASAACQLQGACQHWHVDEMGHAQVDAADL